VNVIPLATTDSVNDCWNRIGVRGDGSCPELERHVHCHNCGVYSSAAQALLNRPLSAEHLSEHSRHFARPKEADEPGTHTVVIFRIAAEWLALPMSALREIVSVRTIHSLPHRRNGSLLGITNVNGELLVSVSLGTLIGLAAGAAPPDEPTRVVHKRFLVIRRDALRVVLPVDEVDGVHRVHPWDLEDMPVTLGKATTRHSTAIIMWRDHAVGLLDEDLLFHALQRSLG
jgi:chemotaxis-related protein WspD